MSACIKSDRIKQNHLDTNNIDISTTHVWNQYDAVFGHQLGKWGDEKVFR